MTSFADSRLIVVGGHTRNIGKTQLICEIVGALPQAGWIAGKITQFGHGLCTRHGSPCACAPASDEAALVWETAGDRGTDSARFLAAGARKSFWLRTRVGRLAEAMPLLRAELARAAAENASAPANVILESNSLLGFVKPALYIAVIHPGQADFKDSARAMLTRANAIVLREELPKATELVGGAPDSGWASVLQLIRGKRRFLQAPGDPLPAGLVGMLSSVLAGDPQLLA